MDDGRLGIAIRSIRLRKGWRQVDLAHRAGASAWQVGRIERGHVETVGLPTVRAIVQALDARLDLTLRWQGADLDRLVNRRHAAMHERIARMLASTGAWLFAPEVSFSIYGERGVIDVLAWHPSTRALLVIELKTEIVDISDLIGTVDRKRRLARQIAKERGWDAATVGVWVVVAESRTNRRRLAAHVGVLRAAFPADGRTMRAWLSRPTGPVSAMGFLPDPAGGGLRPTVAGKRRIRLPNTTPAASGSRTNPSEGPTSRTRRETRNRPDHA